MAGSFRARLDLGRRLLGVVAIGALLATGCEQTPPSEDGEEGGGLMPRVPPKAVEDLAAGRTTDLIVLLDEPAVVPRHMVTDVTRSPDDARSVMHERADVLSRAKHELIDRLPTGTELRQDFEHLPMMYVRVKSLDTLQAMLDRREVVRFYENSVRDAHLASSLDLIDQHIAQSRGFVGEGTSVAILDTGMNHNSFTGCQLGAGSPGCPILYAQDFASEDYSYDDQGHGTVVGRIAHNTALYAGLLSLDVFEPEGAYDVDIIQAINWSIANRDVYDIVAMNMSLGSGGYSSPCTSDVFAGPIATARANGILSVISSGNDAFRTKISSPACVPAAISVGAVYDENLGGTLSYSRCTDTVTGPDHVACFSNSASFLTMLAPGANVCAGGSCASGTSMAAPFVAGSLAVVRSAMPWNTLDEAVSRLTAGGTLVTDARNNVTKPRLDLDRSTRTCLHALNPRIANVSANGGEFTLALDDLSESGCEWWAVSSVASIITLPDAVTEEEGVTGFGDGSLRYQVAANTGPARTDYIFVAGQLFNVNQAADTSAPTATLSINGGAASTRVTGVTLTASASDLSGVSQMCFSAATTCPAANWQTYTTTASFTLPTGDGVKTVRAWFRDANGQTNTTPAATATIRLDTIAPTAGTAKVARTANGQLTVSWSGQTDAGSGVASYRVMSATGAAPANCTTGDPIYAGTALSFAHSGLTNGTTYFYRVCAVDGAGNIAAGATASLSPAADFTPPAGTVQILPETLYTRLGTVQLTLSATDTESAVTQMCISNTAACTAWVAFTGSRSWNITAGDGLKTVSAWFRDAAGNATVLPVTDTINRDSTVPTGGTLTMAKADRQVTLTWSGVTDARSGIDRYKLVYATSASPAASCTGAQVIYEGPNSSFVHTGLNNGTIYYYRLCAVDVAGNTAAGLITNANPAPNPTPPTNGSVVINSGAQFTGPTTAVTLTLSAIDEDVGVSMVCISNTTACTSWTAYSTTKSWTLVTGSGNKTVYVWFRDYWNNTSEVASDTITLDQTAPVFPAGSSLQATAANGTVALTWVGATDAASGVHTTMPYRLMLGTTAAPANCLTGTLLYEGTALSYLHTGINGTTYHYRVCARDSMGNLNAGQIVSARPAPEFDVPAGSVSVTPTYTHPVTSVRYVGTTAVTLTLSASDTMSSVTSMCISNTSTCAATAWQPYATSKAWTLTTGSAVKTVYAWFRDQWNNTSAPATGTITLDLTGPAFPAGSSLQAAAADGAVTLTWAGATDAGSGLHTTTPYRLMLGTTAAPANCSTGTLLYEGTALSYVHTGINGTTYHYRVCARDYLGNLNAGQIVSGRPAPEFDVPTGSVSVTPTYTHPVTSVGYVRTTGVTLTLSASDAMSSVTSMCISNTSTCAATAWQPYATSRAWTLTTGSAVKTVYAWFRDQWNNTSLPTTTTITLDATLPTSGTLSVTPAAAGSQQITIAWSGQSDAASGIASYKLVFEHGVPPHCGAEALYAGTGTSFVHSTTVTAGLPYGYRLCTIDNVGNMSTGATGVTTAP